MSAVASTGNSLAIDASERLRARMAAAKLSVTWLGTRKALNTEQRDQAAGSFGATGKFVSAGKKLLDTSHPAFKAVTAIRGQAVSYWKNISLPFPEPGIRLIKQSEIERFSTRISSLRSELRMAVEAMQDQYEELKSQARTRLGNLYNPDDYPASLVGLFDFDTEFPSVEPPDYMRTLSPELYAQECRRMQSRFEEAVQLAEQAFITELSRLVEHLAERLRGDSDGSPKIFRDSAVTNLTEFFDRFRRLNVRSNQELDELVSEAQQIMRGVNPQNLRDMPSLQRSVAEQMTEVQGRLDTMLIERPRRNILRRGR
jgi:hypothetical protein